jgi:hypothetical protein
MVAELKCLRSENQGLKDERDALKGQVSTLNRMNQIEIERGDFYKDAATKGISIDKNNGLIVTTLQDQVNVCLSQNKGLETENSKLRASRNNRAIFAAIAGAGLGYAAHK